MATRAPKQVVPRRGEVYLVRLNPTVGVEIRKTRPGLVVQNDISNRFGGSTIVVPISSYDEGRLYPTEALIPAREGGLSVASVAICRQLRCVDKSRLVRRLGRLTPETLSKVDRALLITLDLVEV